MSVQRRSPNSGLTLLATGLGLFMVFLDATIVNVALPSIQHDFDVGESGVQWVVAAYSLTMGMFMMTSASLADSWGRRKVYIAGIAIFCVSSLACGLAPGVGFLNAARASQGIGAAVVNVASLALVGAAFPDPAAKARAVGIWTGIAGVGIAVGPSLGGMLTENFGWRWIFLINPLVGVVALALTLAFVTESADPKDRGLDPVGQLLFIIGIGAFTFALVQASTYGFVSAPVIGAFATGSVALVAFLVFELRSEDPMMDLRVFSDIPYTAAIVTMFAALFSAYGTLLVITLLAVVVAARLPGDLESVIPNADERARVVTDITDAANPQAVPSVIGPAPSNPPTSAEVIAEADEAFVEGIRVAESAGAVVTLIALLFAWTALPRAPARETTNERETAASDTN